MARSKPKDLRKGKFNFPIKVGNWRALTPGTKIRFTVDAEVLACSPRTDWSASLVVRTLQRVLTFHPDIELKDIRLLKKRPEPWKQTGGLPRP